jgi:hypothetical protein
MGEVKREWIEILGSEDPEQRAQAAAEIYRTGREQAESAARNWWTNPELVRLCGAPPTVTVGLAVRPTTFARIREANGWPQLAAVPPEQAAAEFELHFAGGVLLDVLTTREETGVGAIARFLAKHGEGVQQVEFRCEDVDRSAAILREQFGVTAVYPVKRAGANGTRVNFFLLTAPDNGKVLIELYEPER